MNALVSAGQGRWFDLRELDVAHPLLDVGWLLAWTSHDARASLPARQVTPDLPDLLWRETKDALGIDVHGARWQDARLVALAHRVVAYERQFRTFEGTTPGPKPYVGDYLRWLLSLAERES
ncbi:hypothetical protein [Deinococcus pimensis]|uniref:hypothetical protein n=1 Tax=Deinococcus pimensis TaxID=309888 RepID=UPI00048147EF|nr:hypothetical protein [Deinococcus pimensis]